MKVQDRGRGTRLLVPAGFEAPGLQVMVQGANNTVRIGEGARFRRGIIEVRGDDCTVEFGARCRFTGEVRVFSGSATVTLGAGTTAMAAKIMMHEPGRIALGADCMLSGGIRMDVSDMHSILDFATGARLNPPADIEIGDHVWIGFGAYLMKGVRIGAHSIIGAQAVVTRDIPPHSLAVGAPARVIRSGVSWDRRRLPWGDGAGQADPGEIPDVDDEA